MMGPMLERSGETAYGPIAKRLATTTEGAFEKTASPPSVIADAIIKALRAKRPKTRYVAGKYARTMLFMRKWGGDRIFDKFVMNFIK